MVDNHLKSDDLAKSEEETQDKTNEAEGLMINPVIRSDRYKTYLFIMIFSQVCCLVLKLVNVAFFIIERSAFRRNVNMIMESVNLGVSGLFLIITMVMAIVNRIKIKEEYTYDLENPFVPFSIRYARASLSFLSLLFYGCSFGYAIVIDFSLNLNIFLILQSI